MPYPPEYDRGYRRRREPRDDPYATGFRGRDRGYRAGGYDERYRRFNEATRPRFSPIGGMHPAMGGRYAYGGDRHRGAGYDGWSSERTRWF